MHQIRVLLLHALLASFWLELLLEPYALAFGQTQDFEPSPSIKMSNLSVLEEKAQLTLAEALDFKSQKRFAAFLSRFAVRR